MVRVRKILRTDQSLMNQIRGNKPLDNVDLAWLRMDDPANLMIITGIMTFDTCLDIDRLKATMFKTMLKFRRFRQRIEYSRLPWRRPNWEDDPEFDIDGHIQKLKLPPPGDQSALHELISELMSYELEYNRPLWQFYIIENYGGGSALICRLHHAIADGISLMQVLLSMADQSPDTPWPSYQPEQVTIPSSRPLFTNVNRFGQAMNSRIKSASSFLEGTSKSKVMPANYERFSQLAINTAFTAGRVILRRPDPITIYKGTLSIKKRAAWSKPLSLNEVKRTGKVFGATINDVLLSVLTGALRKYVQQANGSSKLKNIRGFIPVNLRPIELDEELGNRFGLVFVSLPIGIDDPLMRLHQIKLNMDKLKSSTEPIVTLAIIHLMGTLPTRLQDVAVRIFDTKGSAIITNVPGPREQLFLAGAPINMLMAWVPQSGRIGLGVSIISYNGKVWLGLATDQRLLPDPEQIIDYFYDEFKEYVTLAENAQSSRIQSIDPMLSKLDDTLQTLDYLLASSPPKD